MSTDQEPGWDDATIDWYAETWGEHPSTRALADLAPLAPGEHVLDIGCGTGASLRHLARQARAARLVGADPFARMVGHAERLSAGQPIDFVGSPAERLPFADASFDGVLAVNSVHHWSDFAAGLAEAARVLRPGGWLLIGGEDMGEGWLPGGEAPAEVLAAAGFGGIATPAVEDGYAILARKVGP